MELKNKQFLVDKQTVDEHPVDKHRIDEHAEKPFTGDEQVVSKTQLKNEAKAHRNFAKELIGLSAAKINQLPLSEVTKTAINDFHKQHGNIARKRHLAYIGKCLRNDNAEEAKLALQSNSFEQFRQQQVEESGVNQSRLVEQLISEGDQQIQTLVEQNPTLNRQKLRQLVRNINNAKTAVKKNQAIGKLNVFLKQYQIQTD